MNSIFKSILILFFLFAAYPTILLPQTVEQSAKLQQLSVELREKFDQERNHALKNGRLPWFAGQKNV